MKKEEENQYTVDHFIEKFSNIPTKLWLEGSLSEPDSDAHCALGHLGCKSAKGYDETAVELGKSKIPEANFLNNLFQKHLSLNVYDINDGGDKGWKSGTPKTRILRALNKIKVKMGFKQNKVEEVGLN